jgi:outer membrane biosynthesis protein TonB
MAEEYSQEELNEAFFVQLVFTFQAAAMQQLGKVINPLTGKVEKNMEQAKHSIDMVAMLEEKTRGNLNDREQKLIERVLFELRMNYVDEMKVMEEGGGEKKEEEKEKSEAAEQEAKPKAEKVAREKEMPSEEKKTKPQKKKKSKS